MRFPLLVASLVGLVALAPAAPAALLDYVGECVPFARAASGIQLYGDAWTWWTAADGKYERGTKPREGAVLGMEEALSPEQALTLYLAHPLDLTRTRSLTVAGDADLCLLATSWQEARANLSDVRVRATLIAGRLVHDRVDEPPAQCRRGADALA